METHGNCGSAVQQAEHVRQQLPVLIRENQGMPWVSTHSHMFCMIIALDVIQYLVKAIQFQEVEAYTVAVSQRGYIKNRGKWCTPECQVFP